MVENFASLHAYIATVGFGNASSAPSAHLSAGDAAPVHAPGAIVDKGKPIPSAAAITHGSHVMRDSKQTSRNLDGKRMGAR